MKSNGNGPKVNIYKSEFRENILQNNKHFTL